MGKCFKCLKGSWFTVTACISCSIPVLPLPPPSRVQFWSLLLILLVSLYKNKPVGLRNFYTCVCSRHGQSDSTYLMFVYQKLSISPPFPPGPSYLSGCWLPAGGLPWAGDLMEPGCYIQRTLSWEFRLFLTLWEQEHGNRILLRVDLGQCLGCNLFGH